MRVALVSGYDAGTPGGVQSQVALIAAELAERGDEVTVVSPASGSVTLPPGVRLLRTGRSYPVRANGSVAPVAPTPLSAARTRYALSRLAPDVVHVHEPLLPGPALAAMTGRVRPLVATFHRSGSDPLYRLAGRVLAPLVTRGDTVWTAVSPSAATTARTVLGRHLGEIALVPNGVPIARFARAREEAARTSSSGRFKQSRGPRVVFLGRLERRKGVAVLLAAATLLATPAEILVAGDGPERPALERAAPSQVRFLGRPNDEVAASLLAGADLVIAPALGGESFGIVILEAMASGSAVIASDISGYAEAAAGAARLVPVGEPRPLAQAIDELLSDDVARAELARRGVARAEECAGEKVVSRYRQLYEQATAVFDVGRTTPRS